MVDLINYLLEEVDLSDDDNPGEQKKRSRSSNHRDRKAMRRDNDDDVILDTAGDILGSLAARKAVKKLKDNPELAKKTLKYVPISVGTFNPKLG